MTEMNASHLVSRTAPRRLSRAAARTMATTFDGDMARLYLNFFDQAESAWDNTKDVARMRLKAWRWPRDHLGCRLVREPALTLAKSCPGARPHHGRRRGDGVAVEQRIADRLKL